MNKTTRRSEAALKAKPKQSDTKCHPRMLLSGIQILDSRRADRTVPDDRAADRRLTDWRFRGNDSFGIAPLRSQ